MEAQSTPSEFETLSPFQANPPLKIEQLINRASEIKLRPSLKLLHDTLLKAHQIHANCIYFEPEETFIRIRFRIFGKLHEERYENTELAFCAYRAVQNLSVDSHKKTEDVYRTIVIENKKYAAHAATLPSQPKPSLTINLTKLPPCAPTLDELTIPKSILQPLRTSIQLSTGLFLVTGPSGSQKKHTLMAILQELNSPEKKLISVERHIDQNLPRVSQLQPNKQQFQTFSQQLLNQTPDIISLDKIHDAQISHEIINSCTLNSALFKSMDANCAISAILELMNQGVSPTLLSRTLHSILIQQPLNNICEYCKAPEELNTKQEEWIKNNFPTSILEKGVILTGEGCEHCHHSGFNGVSIVYELIDINREMSLAIASKDLDTLTTEIMLRKDFQTLKSRAFNLARQGTITLDQAMRVQ